MIMPPAVRQAANAAAVQAATIARGGAGEGLPRDAIDGPENGEH